ncbi:MAG TPA: molybdenum cofactor biosynthesis protein MoaE [Candidatus Eisenbacteria bacterium]
MIVRIATFAGLRDDLGAPEVELTLPDGATAADLLAAVERRWPRLTGRLGSVRVAADLEFLAASDPIPVDAELALIPPVSGGAPPDDEMIRKGSIVDPDVSVLLEAAPIHLPALLHFVRTPSAGAVVTFTGTVREISRDRRVVELEYEAYHAMALEWLRRLASRSRGAFPVCRVAVAHRLGVVPVAEESVAIAVSSPHRAAAFDACRAVIEGLKADVPIWKRERYHTGDEWVGWGS